MPVKVEQNIFILFSKGEVASIQVWDEIFLFQTGLFYERNIQFKIGLKNSLNSTIKSQWFLNEILFFFQLGTNFRDCLNNWNIGTNFWLRFVVYERTSKKYATILTFSLSALWHGFYPGYYLTFATGALFVEAARKVSKGNERRNQFWHFFASQARRMFRHHFQKTELSRTFYDAVTCIVTRFFLSYATTTFVLLELGVRTFLFIVQFFYSTFLSFFHRLVFVCTWNYSCAFI